MPVQAAAFTGGVVEAFFDGLLPEGEALKMIAYDFNLSATDAYGLLQALGRDCAGALQILPADSTLEPGAGALELLTDEQVAERLRRLRHSPLGVDERVRISLAGVQEKMVLTLTESGWALPLDGAPSTHILKPSHPHLAHSVANEALCLRIAKHAGVATTEAEVSSFVGRDVLIVERYDRTHVGPTHRIHQEDMCQAQGISPREKYEEHGGPSLASCAEILNLWTRGDHSLLQMLAITTINVAIGNADAHGKNLSLMHHANGAAELAPAYDLLCTRYYDVDTTAGMFVDGIRHIDHIAVDNLVAEGTSWGIPEPRARAHVEQLVNELPDALKRAAAEIAAPANLVTQLRKRMTRLGKGLTAAPGA